MIGFINSWAQQIVIAVIITTIIEIILPDGKNKKYVKTILGIYVLFSIINPLINKISKNNLNFNQIVENVSKEISKYESQNILTIETSKYIENTYKQKIEEDIKKEVLEKGYKVSNLDLSLETKDESNYGKILKINMQVNKIDTEGTEKNNINMIEEVKINLNENNEKILKEVDIDEINKLKEDLSSTYQIDIQNIFIN